MKFINSSFYTFISCWWFPVGFDIKVRVKGFSVSGFSSLSAKKYLILMSRVNLVNARSKEFFLGKGVLIQNFIPRPRSDPIPKGGDEVVHRLW